MRRNLQAAGASVMSESLVATLGAKIGFGRARAVVDAAVASDDVRGALGVALSPHELEAALSPEAYLGSAQAFIDRALAEYGDG
jgi:3-carboxy-cis,cis-muconate cycloisomerase